MPLPRVNPGDEALSRHVQILNDILDGAYGWAIKLIRTLTLKAESSTSTVLDIQRADGTSLMSIRQGGTVAWRLSDYLDITQQGAAPAAPGAATGIGRLYLRAGVLYLKVEGGAEQALAIQAPSGGNYRSGWFVGED